MTPIGRGWADGLRAVPSQDDHVRAEVGCNEVGTG
jgi:hypothetical protein